MRRSRRASPPCQRSRPASCSALPRRSATSCSCDFFIGKPGPGSISEAIQQGLPVIVVNNTWTMPQERYNAVWVSETRTGIVLDTFKDVRAGVDEVIARLPELRTRVARIENRAVFEIPEILDRLLHANRPAAVVPRDLARLRGLRESHRPTGALIR